MSDERSDAGERVEVGLLDLIRVPASDVGAAVAFYRDVLGATVQSLSAEWATVRLANVDLGIHRRDGAGAGAGAGPGWEPGFRVRDVAAFRARLAASGAAITKEPHDIPGGVRLGLADPDGNRLAAYQYGVTVADLGGAG